MTARALADHGRFAKPAGCKHLLACQVKPCVAPLFVLTLAICVAGLGDIRAAPPPDVQRELSQLEVVQLMRSVESLPESLKQSLAKTFRQSSLQLGNLSDLSNSSVTYTNDPAFFEPYRRLIFAFDTPHYHFVYYQHGPPENAESALAFTNDKHLRLVWGGVALPNRVARSPQELAARIVKGKFFDDKPFIW